MAFQCSCVFCDSGNVSEVIYQNKVNVGRRRVDVNGFRKSVCGDCLSEFYSLAQIDSNKALIEATTRDRPGVVFPGLIRGLRDEWNLTQRQAAQLFGAGANSVAKWETGQSPSGPAALLIQCALYVPGVMEYLCKLADLEVKRERTPWDAGINMVGYSSKQSTSALLRKRCSHPLKKNSHSGRLQYTQKHSYGVLVTS